MRRAFALSVVLCAAVSLQAAAETFPYTVRVAAGGATVRSGPGPTYYPTAELAAGEEVEVYRLDPGGWCAIRPPEGSFSWVPAESVELASEEGLGKVAGENVTTRIGSRIGPEHDVSYVQLEPGELVEILGAERVTGENGASALWFRIAPPAGEFRWVALGDLQPRLASGERQPDVELAAADGGTSEWIEVDTSAGGGANVPAQFVEREPATPIAGTSPAEEGFRAVPSPTQQVQTLDGLEVEFAAMVARDPSQWQLDDLRQRTAAATAATADRVQQVRGQALLARIDEFRNIYAQYSQLSTLPEVTQAGRPRGDLLSALATGLGGNPYDGTGYLSRVRTTEAGKALYGLTDTNGQILQLVSPAPGINLSVYEGRRVGIIGQRGYHRRLQKPHVMAERIIDLDRQLR